MTGAAAEIGAATGTSRLEASGLQKSYGARMVVKDVHLAVSAGEVVGLLGPNGAGKTTTFYMVVGLVRADAGQILIDGQHIETLPIHQRSRLGLSYLPQEASVFRKLTVQENILLRPRRTYLYVEIIKSLSLLTKVIYYLYISA